MGSSLNQSADEKQSGGWQTDLLAWCLKTIAASYVVIIVSVFVCLVLALRQLQGPPVYKVEALVIQNSEPASSLRSTGSSSPLSAVLGGGAVSSMPEIDEFQILLGSTQVADILDKKYHLLREVYRNSWDVKNNRWYPYRPGFLARLHAWFVNSIGGISTYHDPNNYDLASFLYSKITVDRVFFNSVMSVSMTTDRPEDAKRWLSIVIYEVSDIVRSQMINERQNYVNYLLQQLSQSALTTSRDATITILADQYRALMVLKSAKTFPLQQIQPPTRAQYPVNKSVSFFMLIGILSGLMVAGVLIALGLRDASLWAFFSRLGSYFRKT
jgi:hypothetical protein